MLALKALGSTGVPWPVISCPLKLWFRCWKTMEFRRWSCLMRIQSLWVPSLALALKSWLLFQMISLLSWTIMIEPRRGFAETSLVTISMEELQSSIFFSSLLFIVSVICIPNSIAFAFETVVIFPVSLFHWCYELINYHSSYSHPQYPYRCHSLIFSLVNLNLTFCILWEEAVGINLLLLPCRFH